MGTLGQLVRRLLRNQEKAEVAWALLKSEKWWGSWVALALAWFLCYVGLWQIAEPWALPDWVRIPRGGVFVLLSLMLALVIMLIVVDCMKRWLWHRLENQAEAQAAPAQPSEPQQPPKPPQLSGSIPGPDRRLCVKELHYELWTHRLRLDWEKGDLLVSAQVYETDPLSGRILTKPPFRHLEAFMGAVSLYQIPSPVVARLVVYRKDPRGAIVAKITADFHLHESPAKVVLVGGPAEQTEKAKATVDRVATELLAIPDVSPPA